MRSFHEPQRVKKSAGLLKYATDKVSGATAMISSRSGSSRQLFGFARKVAYTYIFLWETIEGLQKGDRFTRGVLGIVDGSFGNSHHLSC